MILVLDVGNTNITLGVYENGLLKCHWRLSSKIARTADEIWIMIKALCEDEGVDPRAISGLALGSVVPSVSTLIGRMLEKRFQPKYVEVNHMTNTGLTIKYNTPQSVGADRICNAVAGFQKYGGPLIIVDFGTATTFDVISKNAEYLGGIIAPGLESTVSSLHHFAARLPQVELKFPASLIGRSTESSMQSGLMYGGAEMVEGLIRRLRDELGKDATVITTGGLAEVLMPQLPSVERFEPFLTLDGLHLIFQQNQ